MLVSVGQMIIQLDSFTDENTDGRYCARTRNFSQRSNGSKSVMFTDEVGNTLAEIKKYDETEHGLIH